jgi:hypothetical protein
MASSGMLRRVVLVRSDVSEELCVSIIRVTRIGERGTTLAVTSNRRTPRARSVELRGNFSGVLRPRAVTFPVSPHDALGLLGA